VDSVRSFSVEEMDNLQHDDSESPVCSETACSAVASLMSCSSSDVTSPTTEVPLKDMMDSIPGTPGTGDFPSENSPNSTDDNCENCTPSESDRSFDVHLVTSHSEASDDEKMSSATSSHDAALPLTATECTEDVGHSADDEPHSCAPIFAVRGAREEELKRGLEQRLGLVLSKLARETEEDSENVDDRQHRESLQTISDHSEQEDIVDQPGASETDTTDTTTDECSDSRHIFMMDIVQEMDEVERYSYVSLVAYAMHQLFEYSTWNQYVILCLLIIQSQCI